MIPKELESKAKDTKLAVEGLVNELYNECRPDGFDFDIEVSSRGRMLKDGTIAGRKTVSITIKKEF